VRWQRPDPTSLRLKLAAWLLAPLLALLALDAYLTFQRARAASTAAFDRVLYASAKQIQEGVQARDGQIEVDLPYVALDLFESSSLGRVFYRVSIENGTHLTGYDDLPLPATPSNRFFRPTYYGARYRGDDVRAVALRMPVQDTRGAPVQTVWIVVAETPEARNELARGILIGSLAQELALVGLVLVIFIAAGRAVLQPIQRLSAAVAGRDEAHPTPLEVDGLPSELQPLSTALNQYTARMQQMLQARRRFFDDAAHQLKTPLTVARTQAELALRESLPAAAALHLRSVLGTLQTASGGVEKLLSLARLEPDNGIRYLLSPCDLSVIAREAALEWSPLARARQVDLGLDAEPEVFIRGDPLLVQELIGNLLDNAIHHAGPGAKVTVQVSAGPPARLRVVDDGPGIPAALREDALKRFHRLPGTTHDGTGLGLAIVREIARVHGAEMALGDAPGGGLTVELRFRNEAPGPAA
jgi:two-component system sensor histidine kinase TctE